VSSSSPASGIGSIRSTRLEPEFERFGTAAVLGFHDTLNRGTICDLVESTIGWWWGDSHGTDPAQIECSGAEAGYEVRLEDCCPMPVGVWDPRRVIPGVV
jgi:hypothetical protein